eukprot:TRINITY_DN2411_c0_g1_i4.p1 TRINITY_DN2411_c0_g1~~TRINITY_DN2411_c0_g1_i4.p1  ORF type:complete len:459 (-),score=104.07 TRINITY_DN2411_c0_g1_i4:677-2053(-)
MVEKMSQKKVLTPEKFKGDHEKWIDNVLSTMPNDLVHNQDRLQYVNAKEALEGVSIDNKLIRKKLGIKSSSVMSRYHKKIAEGLESKRPGRPSTVPHDIYERIIPQIVDFRIRNGRWVKTCELVQIVMELAREMKKHVDEKKLDKDWVYGFLKDNKDKIIRKNATIVQKKRHIASSFNNLNEFMDLIAPMLLDCELNDKQALIGNWDETVMSLDMKGKKVTLIGLNQAESFLLPNDDNVSLKVSMVQMIAGDGSAPLPGMAYGNKNCPWDMKKHSPHTLHDFILLPDGTSEGYQTVDSLIQYLKEAIIPHFVQKREDGGFAPDTSCYLFCDGLGIHEDPKILELCAENNIVLIKFPAHCTHILQPLDLTFFAVFKSFFHKYFDFQLRAVEKKMERSAMLKNNLKSRAAIMRFVCMQTAWLAFEKARFPTVIQESFERSGLIPFDKARVVGSSYACRKP